MNPEWLDKNGFVKTKRVFADSGNGAVYTVIAMALNESEQYIPLTPLWDAKRGVLMRTPENTYGQESHDNYMAVAIYCMRFNPRWARVILWSAIKKLGFMQNDFTEGNAFWKSWMGRFPHLWVTMIASAFPNRVVFCITRNLLMALMSSQKINLQDASGIQLQWLNYYAIKLMGTDAPMRAYLMRLRSMGTSMSKVMRDQKYWDDDHPVLDGYDRFEKEMIG